ncbi:hypothetical protein TNCV_3222741 [Trichonephila clavipes]|uniref:Uncharacterized protein n=1 Tax=Trichonephila clavipes TaxID=2585209 RepID=A0A8X6V1D4_TRICX|nr:hypothetical protein TNCV_3222741 [Trichonephila clavipes]
METPTPIPKSAVTWEVTNHFRNILLDRCVKTGAQIRGPKPYNPVDAETTAVSETPSEDENQTVSSNHTVPELLVLRCNPSKARDEPRIVFHLTTIHLFPTKNPWKSKETK